MVHQLTSSPAPNSSTIAAHIHLNSPQDAAKQKMGGKDDYKGIYFMILV